VAATFPDVEALAATCRFDDCEHESEPGCAVLAAVDSGSLSVRRLESWRRLQREAAWMAARTDARLRAQMARKWKHLSKQQRASSNPKTRP
jgi:ribosome biogenesis GTPase